MLTANNMASPNNNYGWGIIDTWAALHFSFVPTYIPGDADGNGHISISDAVRLISYIFSGGASPSPPESGDLDCNGGISISDVVFIVQFIFNGGNAPVLCP